MSFEIHLLFLRTLFLNIFPDFPIHFSFLLHKFTLKATLVSQGSSESLQEIVTEGIYQPLVQEYIPEGSHTDILQKAAPDYFGKSNPIISRFYGVRAIVVQSSKNSFSNHHHFLSFQEYFFLIFRAIGEKNQELSLESSNIQFLRLISLKNVFQVLGRINVSDPYLLDFLFYPAFHARHNEGYYKNV